VPAFHLESLFQASGPEEAVSDCFAGHANWRDVHGVATFPNAPSTDDFEALMGFIMLPQA
jgi:hypothetical protein